MFNVRIWRGVFAMLFLIVSYLTVTPNPDDSGAGMALTRWLASLFLGNPGLSDKIAHFLAYGALGGSAALARLPWFKKIWAAPLGLAAYGVVLEGVQALGGVRSPEFADAIANALGAVVGFCAGYGLLRYARRTAP